MSKTLHRDLGGRLVDQGRAIEFRPAAGTVWTVWAGPVFLWFFVNVLVAIALLAGANIVWLNLITMTAFLMIYLLPAAIVYAVQIRFHQYTVFARGLRKKSGIIVHQTNEIPWQKITGVAVKRNFMDRLLGTAKLVVFVYGEKGTTVKMLGLRGADQLNAFVTARLDKANRATPDVQSD